MYKLFLFLIGFLSVLHSPAAGVFNYDFYARAAYDAFMKLDADAGKKYITAGLKANPDNLLLYYIEDYGDFLELFINGDPQIYAKTRAHYDERLGLIERGNSSDPYYNFCKAGIHLHWAVIYARFDEKLKAAAAMRKSFSLLRENMKKYPSFAPNNVYYGLEEAVAGTIPDEYKWIASVLGLKGNVNGGVQKLVSYLNNRDNDFLQQEAAIYYSYTKFYLQTQSDVIWRYINSKQFAREGDLLKQFVYVNIALNNKNSSAALKAINQAATYPGFNDYPALQLEKANALFYQLDHACITAYNEYLRRDKSGDFRKFALKNIALIQYIEGDVQQAMQSRSRILTTGNARTDEDKQSQRFAKEKGFPNKLLLKGRILFDGGDFSASRQLLESMNSGDFNNESDQLEYLYRLGRVYEETGNRQTAIGFYSKAFQMGKDKSDQFGARAALQLGLLYENSHNRNMAAYYFKQALSLKNHDFQSSIDQQAKAGLFRVKG